MAFLNVIGNVDLSKPGIGRIWHNGMHGDASKGLPDASCLPSRSSIRSKMMRGAQPQPMQPLM